MDKVKLPTELREIKVLDDNTIVFWTKWEIVAKDRMSFAAKFLRYDENVEVLEVRRFKNYNNAVYSLVYDNRDAFIASTVAYKFIVKGPIDILKFLESAYLEGVHQ